MAENSDRDRAEEATARLAAIVESSDDAIIGKTLDGVITSWNPGAERIYGYSAEEVVGKPISILIPPDRPDELPSIMARLGRGERIEHFETVRMCKDGRRIAVSLSISPIRDASGRIVGAVAIARDITERNRAAEALRKSEATLSQAGHMAHLGAWEIPIFNQDDLNANPLWWSDEVYRIFGYEPGRVPVTSQLFFERIHPEDRQRVVDAVAQAIAQKQPYSVEHRIVRPDGTERIVLEHAQITFDEGGRPLRIDGAVQDITERRQVEQEREHLLAELREANRRLLVAGVRNQELAEASQRRAAELQSVLDSMVDGVLVCDLEGRVTLANEAGARLTGLSGVAQTRRTLDELLSLLRIRRANGKPLAPREMALSRALAGQVVVAEDQILHDARTGLDRYIRVSAAPIRDEAGEVVGAVAVIRDVTELTELDRLKDEFLAVAAHELKTPVAAMKGYAQVLLRGSDRLSPTHRRMLEAIDRGAGRIDRVVMGLLDITRLQGGHLSLTVDRVNLTELVAEVADRAALTTERHQIQVEPAKPVVVQADRDRLEQVLFTLLDNAIRYSPDGGEIGVAVTAGAGEVVVSVRDRGVGIPTGRQAHIFERFYRAHTRTPYDYGGMGVGLYIACELVKRHGGRMWFESQEGQGSAFHFGLPLTGASGDGRPG